MTKVTKYSSLWESSSYAEVSFLCESENSLDISAITQGILTLSAECKVNCILHKFASHIASSINNVGI